MSDGELLSRIEASIGCHFTRRDAIEYRDNTAHYTVDPDTGRITGLRLPMRVRVIPPEVCHLTALTVLDVSLVKVPALPDGILELRHLRKLNLYDSEVEMLPPELGILSELENINLARTPLEALPDSLCTLKKLKKLYLWGTRIRELPRQIGQLRQLQLLDLTDCRLRTLPESILQLDLDFRDDAGFDCIKITDLSIDDKAVSACVRQGKAELAAYFRERALHPEPVAFESRVVLLGSGGAGKTCIMHALLNNFFDPVQKKTRGIQVADWLVEDAGKRGCVHIWDFGGQEVYQPLYPLFLAKADLYLVVLNGRSDERADEWLEFLRFFSPHAPVILVVNRIDENPRARVDAAYLKRKFSDVRLVDILYCSCKDYARPEGHMEALRQSILRNLRETGLQLRPSEDLDRIRQSLRQQEKAYSRADLLACCDACGICAERRERLLEELCDYGLLLKPNGSTLFFVDPDWLASIANGIYRYAEEPDTPWIFSQQEVLSRFLSADDPVREAAVDSIFSALGKSGLCILQDDQVLIPSLLPLYAGDYRQEHGQQDQYVILYGTSPVFFFHRLLSVLFPRRTEDTSIWCNAIQVRLLGETVFVEQQGNEISFFLSSTLETEKLNRCVGALLSALQEVHDTLQAEQIQFQVYIPERQRRNTEMIKNFYMYGGQFNAPSDHAIVNASYQQEQANVLNGLLRGLEAQFPGLEEADRRLAQQAAVDLQQAMAAETPDKGLLKKALHVLQGIKGTVEFGAAVAGVAQFLQTFLI